MPEETALPSRRTWLSVSGLRPAARHAVTARGGAQLLARRWPVSGGWVTPPRDLAHRLYLVPEGKRWAKEVGPYKALGAAWPEIARRDRPVAERPGHIRRLDGLRLPAATMHTHTER